MPEFIPFDGQNVVYLCGGIPNCADLPVFRSVVPGEQPSITSAWRFTGDELKQIRENGGVFYVQMLTEGPPPAIRLRLDNPATPEAQAAALWPNGGEYQPTAEGTATRNAAVAHAIETFGRQFLVELGLDAGLALDPKVAVFAQHVDAIGAAALAFFTRWPGACDDATLKRIAKRNDSDLRALQGYDELRGALTAVLDDPAVDDVFADARKQRRRQQAEALDAQKHKDPGFGPNLDAIQKAALAVSDGLADFTAKVQREIGAVVRELVWLVQQEVGGCPNGKAEDAEATIAELGRLGWALFKPRADLYNEPTLRRILAGEADEFADLAGFHAFDDYLAKYVTQFFGVVRSEQRRRQLLDQATDAAGEAVAGLVAIQEADTVATRQTRSNGAKLMALIDALVLGGSDGLARFDLRIAVDQDLGLRLAQARREIGLALRQVLRTNQGLDENLVVAQFGAASSDRPGVKTSLGETLRALSYGPKLLDLVVQYRRLVERERDSPDFGPAPDVVSNPQKGRGFVDCLLDELAAWGEDAGATIPWNAEAQELLVQTVAQYERARGGRANWYKFRAWLRNQPVGVGIGPRFLDAIVQRATSLSSSCRD